MAAGRRAAGRSGPMHSCRWAYSSARACAVLELALCWRYSEPALKSPIPMEAASVRESPEPPPEPSGSGLASGEEREVFAEAAASGGPVSAAASSSDPSEDAISTRIRTVSRSKKPESASGQRGSRLVVRQLGEAGSVVVPKCRYSEASLPNSAPHSGHCGHHRSKRSQRTCFMRQWVCAVCPQDGVQKPCHPSPVGHCVRHRRAQTSPRSSSKSRSPGASPSLVTTSPAPPALAWNPHSQTGQDQSASGGGGVI
mmetsp:Transcript_16689/g.54802  ORF Transcript_16689/g.54802 Transcript_16689/m.54802 type:complete len:255 (-) Transcript_16689:20-784(-)